MPQRNRSQRTESTRRPTPRKRTSSRRAQSHDGAREAEPRGGAMAPAAILAFVVVAVLAVGGFALWRHFAAPAPVEEQGEQQVEKAEPEDPKVERLLSELTLEQKVAQLFVVRPEGITGVGVAVAAGDATREAITKYPVGGICYFSDNLQTPEQVREMLRNSQNYSKDACGLPLFTCVDEEGGTVVRVADNAAFDVQNVGDMADIGATGDVEKARDAANLMGTYLADLGFNVDFAPVADIATSEDGTMAARSFGDTPELVSSMVVAQVEGFGRANVLCAVKHFPGIGDVEGDSHNGRIYSHQSADEMLAWSIVPFAAAMEEGVPMVMVGHLSCLELGKGEGDLPASLSPAVIDGLLREELGYTGLVITDSLEMGAIEDVCDADEQGVLAIRAGADLVLLPTDFEQAYQGLLKAVKSGDISEERIDESVRRIIRAKLSVGA